MEAVPKGSQLGICSVCEAPIYLTQGKHPYWRHVSEQTNTDVPFHGAQLQVLDAD